MGRSLAGYVVLPDIACVDADAKVGFLGDRWLWNVIMPKSVGNFEFGVCQLYYSRHSAFFLPNLLCCCGEGLSVGPLIPYKDSSIRSSYIQHSRFR